MTVEENSIVTIQNSVINKAIDFIFDNIDNEITVDDVARHCSYSKYHLMRMFKEHTDEALYQFIKRTRIERSAWRLKVEKDKSITEIGIDYGYSSSNFATAFKRHLNITPASLFHHILIDHGTKLPVFQTKGFQNFFSGFDHS